MLDGEQRAKLEHPLSVAAPSNVMKKTKFLYPPPFSPSHNPGIALTGTWCAPGIREGDGAGSAALTVALLGERTRRSGRTEASSRA